MMRGINDQAWRADLLADVLRSYGDWGWVHVNLIPLNPTPGSKWTASDPADEREFVRRLEAKGIPTTVRDTRGREIDGACGQLAATEADPGRVRAGHARLGQRSATGQARLVHPTCGVAEGNRCPGIPSVTDMTTPCSLWPRATSVRSTELDASRHDSASWWSRSRSSRRSTASPTRYGGCSSTSAPRATRPSWSPRAGRRRVRRLPGRSRPRRNGCRSTTDFRIGLETRAGCAR